MDSSKAAHEILAAAGGRDNIRDVTRCLTRLRLVVADDARVDRKALSRVEGVIQAVDAGGQLQVVLGAKVEQVYDAFLPLVGISDDASAALGGPAARDAADGGTASRTPDAGSTGDAQASTPTVSAHESLGNRALQVISKMFTPLIPAIAASGLIKGLLTAANLVAKQNGVDITGSDTYVLLFAASQVIFYFMPVFLGYTAAKALRCNEIIAMILGAFLCYPQVDKIIQDVGTATTIYGLPVVKMAWTIGDATRVFSYTESVIPILLAVAVLALLERGLRRVVPEILQIILVPGLSLAIMLPLVLSLLGPVGIVVGNAIQVVYNALVGFNAMLGGAVIGGLWGVLVIFGAHRALLPVGLNDVAVAGRQNLLAFAGAANFAQGGAALGVMLKTKSEELKGVAAAAVVSAVLVGITEPAIYGCNLRLKRPMVCAIAAGAAGGAIMGLGGVYGDAFANNGVLTVFTYASFGIAPFLFYLAGCAVAFFGAAAATFVAGFEDMDAEAEAARGPEALL